MEKTLSHFSGSHLFYLMFFMMEKSKNIITLNPIIILSTFEMKMTTL